MVGMVTTPRRMAVAVTALVAGIAVFALAYAGARTVEFTFDMSQVEQRLAEDGFDLRVIRNEGSLTIDDDGNVTGGMATVEVEVSRDGEVLGREQSNFVFLPDGVVEHSTNVEEFGPDGTTDTTVIEHPVNDYTVELEAGTGRVVVNAEGEVRAIEFDPMILGDEAADGDGETRTIEFTFDLTGQQQIAADAGFEFAGTENGGRLVIDDDGNVVGGTARIVAVLESDELTRTIESTYVFRDDGTAEHTTITTDETPDGTSDTETVENVGDITVDLEAGTGDVVANEAGDTVSFEFEPVTLGAEAAPAGEDGDGGTNPLVIVIPIVGAVAALGAGGRYLYRRTRERGAPGEGEKDEGAQLGTVPPPFIPSETPGCDWALYYQAENQTHFLRQAKLHECCKYIVKVRTVGIVNEWASQGRQLPVDEQPAGDGERFRNPYGWFVPNGLGFGLTAAARSGPFGTLDWMQGLGDAEPSGGGAKPPEETEDGAVQLRTLEEPPDVAAHWDYCEYTYITVDLHSECPDHVNGYDLRGSLDDPFVGRPGVHQRAPRPRVSGGADRHRPGRQHRAGRPRLRHLDGRWRGPGRARRLAPAHARRRRRCGRQRSEGR